MPALKTRARLDLSPPLKWAGKKLWLAKFLFAVYEFYRDSHGWYSPFGGALGDIYGVQPQSGLVTETCPHLVDFYHWIVDTNGFIPVEFRFDYSRDYKEEVYYEKRARFNEMIVDGDGDIAERVMLFYYLNRSCFNGLCRFKKTGDRTFNTPMGKYTKVNYAQNFYDHARLLKPLKIECRSYNSEEPFPWQFIYADPPFLGKFDTYSGVGMTWKDHEELCYWLAQSDGPVMASNDWDEKLIKLYRDNGFYILRVMAPRSMSCKANGRGKVPEMLAYKNIPMPVIIQAVSQNSSLFEAPI